MRIPSSKRVSCHITLTCLMIALSGLAFFLFTNDLGVKVYGMMLHVFAGEGIKHKVIILTAPD